MTDPGDGTHDDGPGTDTPDDDGRVVRGLGVVLAPFVAAGEATGNGLMRFFGLAEKLDPLKLGQRLLAPLQPLALTIGRFFQTIFGPMGTALTSVLRSVFGWITPFSSAINGFAKRVGVRFRSWGRAVLAATEPTREILRSLGRRIGTLWRRSIGPARRARARAAAWTQRIRRSIGREKPD